ncbi:SsrA-binding protein SmpB [Pseudoalteromonas sp. OFAV1]|jgi:SsrA-binding protein|uniref:SsrA-binding protein SmpB n=1 Tax=Pseudoalteromonas sp. OFAV1 TaxID=2908892 RepID=UPI001F29654C|nr:SsrA-binding protein SmpB [Pseudoalteromonas sp. OFAV1]MCF2902744.1 SsrA-binding protein SmpB [Pseudoalteromonas sp. OFAV1]
MSKSIIDIKSTGFNFSPIKKYKAGLKLSGWMVKSIRSNKISASDGAYITHKNGELFVHGLHLTAEEYHKGFECTDPNPTIKLLLNRNEIDNLIGAVNKDGMTIVLKKLFWEKHLVKAEIWLARGKNNHDKRQTIKNREGQIEARRAMKNAS